LKYRRRLFPIYSRTAIEATLIPDDPAYSATAVTLSAEVYNSIPPLALGAVALSGGARRT